jgi:hypothetical protein
MSEPSIPPPNNEDKPDTLIIQFTRCDQEAYGVEEMRLFLGDRMRVIKASDEPPPKPTRRRPARKSGLYAVLHAAQQHGFTHPREGFWTMLPKEFDAVLALEPKPIAQVVLEVLRQTIGTPVYGQDGHSTRQEWAAISKRHFARAGLMDYKSAQRGITGALDKGYILRRRVGAQRFEYAIRWRGSN